jgi:hypothetical protein
MRLRCGNSTLCVSHDLQQKFDDFVRGSSQADAFEYELLVLCKAAPQRSWEALALLDQHYRRGKISLDLCRTLRHKIERQVLGLPVAVAPPVKPPVERLAGPPVAQLTPPPVAPLVEPSVEQLAAPPVEHPVAQLAAPPVAPSISPPPEPSVPSAMPEAHVPDTTPAADALAGHRWPRSYLTGPVLALMAVVFGVAAPPAVQDALESQLDASRLAVVQASLAAAPAVHNADPPSLSLASDRYVVRPNQHVAEISVERTRAAGEVSFSWWTKTAGAKPDQDYIAGSARRVQMTDGVASVKLYVPILANPARHHIETFDIMIGKPGGGAGLGPIDRATVFILPAENP